MRIRWERSFVVGLIGAAGASASVSLPSRGSLLPFRRVAVSKVDRSFIRKMPTGSNGSVRRWPQRVGRRKPVGQRVCPPAVPVPRRDRNQPLTVFRDGARWRGGESSAAATCTNPSRAVDTLDCKSMRSRGHVSFLMRAHGQAHPRPVLGVHETFSPVARRGRVP